jgi:hypothetical protein
MSKHTLGPWNAYESDGQTYVESLGPKVTDVCRVMRHLPFEEVQANAALIAAAPDMLEALKEARFWVARVAESGNASALKSLAQIDAAIAKAEPA